MRGAQLRRPHSLSLLYAVPSIQLKPTILTVYRQTKIVDAANFLISSGKIRLWPFIETALNLRGNSRLPRRRSQQHVPYEHLPIPSANGEYTLLALLKNVYNAGLDAMNPTAPQRLRVAHAIESISRVLDGDSGV